MRPRRAGYSLLEVLIAFAVMALVLAALLPGQSRLMGRAATAGETLLAQDYAQSLIAEAGIARPLQPGTTTATYRDWQIETRVSEETEPHLYLGVTVTISRAGRTLATATGLHAP